MSLKKKFSIAAMVSVATLATAPAMAALPTEALDAFTTISTDAGTLITNAWPIVLLVTGGLISIKLFRRIIGSAT